MGHRLHSLVRRVERALVVGIIGSALVSLSAAAQIGNDNTLGALIEGLRGLEDAGGTFGAGSNTLDALRDEARDEASQRTNEQEGNIVALTPSERLLAGQFCRGEIDSNDGRLLLIDERFSSIERDFCQRAGSLVNQIGYRVFEGRFGNEVLAIGALGENFVLGPGDELVISFIGAESSTNRVKVNKEGVIALAKVPPVPAAGLTLGEFRRELAQRVEASFVATESFATVGKIREVAISVTGEVRNPGLKRMTALSSVVDALGVAGGVKKSGSLRRVRLERGNQILWFDLYDLLFDSDSLRTLQSAREIASSCRQLVRSSLLSVM